MGGGKGSKVDYGPLADAQRYAADLQYKATKEGQEIQQRQYQETVERYQPWVDAGTYAIQELEDGVRTGAFDFGDFDPPGLDNVAEFVANDPGYQYRFNQGTEAIKRQGNIQGSAYSGANQKALTAFGQALGSDEYSKAYGRAVDKYNFANNQTLNRQNQLSGLAGRGYQAVNSVSGYGAQNANAQTQLGLQGAAYLGQGAIGAAQTGIDQQIYNNQVSQQRFSNVFSTVVGLGSLGLGGFNAYHKAFP